MLRGSGFEYVLANGYRYRQRRAFSPLLTWLQGESGGLLQTKLLKQTRRVMSSHKSGIYVDMVELILWEVTELYVA
jgi:hypothetical protein